MALATKITSSPQLQELARDGAQCACALGNVLMLYSDAPLEREYCLRTVQAIQQYARAYPAGLGLLIMVSANEPPPSDATRQVIRESYLAMKELVLAGALVLEGEGFVAAAKRSIMTLMTNSASQPFPMRVASNTLDGATKLSKMLGARLDPALSPEQIAAAAVSVKARSL